MKHSLVLLTLLALVVFAGAGGAAPSVFPGENGKLAIVSYDDSGGSDNSGIFFVNPDGSGLDYVEAAGEAGNPDWSADGEHLVVAADDGMKVLDADGNLVREFGFWGDEPAWSPDKQHIVYVELRRENGGVERDLVVMDADGSNRRRLTDTPGDDVSPDWSPNGNKIVFASERDGDFEIFVMNADGSNQRPLTSYPDHDGHPDWSPDGRRIVFHRTGVSRTDHEEIFVMRADGARERRITRSANWSWVPAWSPNGRKIVFARLTNVAIMNADGTNLVRLPLYAPDWFDVDWQPRPAGDGD